MKFKFTDLEKKTLSDLISSKGNFSDIFKHSMDKLVKIVYSVPNAKEIYGREYPLCTTFGIIVNISIPKIHIINKSGCYEIIEVKDIEQMVEIEVR